MTVIDVHAHIYPDKIAERAVNAVGEFYLVDMYGKGTAEHLLESQKLAPISRFVVHSVATSSHAVTAINDFIAAQCREHEEFIGFMAMHQDFPDPEAEIERAISLGLVGMKLHPDTQKVDMDDPRLMCVYEMIEGRMPLIVHTGDYRTDFSHPRRLKRILRAFPDLVVDAAHFGGWSLPEIAYDLLHSENVFIDASSSMAFLGSRRTRELARMWGTDRVMFGSDFPMWDPAREFDLFTSLGFTDDELEKMLGKNAERFMGLERS
ncbi:amidohydrolase [Gordonibacter sp. An230]|uniref:amidohydrolase family protein n=1 Tax=Gordonibacter sp. An230 TaxID=1965592 RepID=UPI000B3AD79C|nr:amidohydrolase family protein [Gordonibacter sp. An230]OUO89541.1 amidohydrolase [Gordonibacter sp. An230]